MNLYVRCFLLYVIVFLFFSFFFCNLITSLFKVLSCLDEHYSYLQDIKYCNLDNQEERLRELMK